MKTLSLYLKQTQAKEELILLIN